MNIPYGFYKAFDKYWTCWARRYSRLDNEAKYMDVLEYTHRTWDPTRGGMNGYIYRVIQGSFSYKAKRPKDAMNVLSIISDTDLDYFIAGGQTVADIETSCEVKRLLSIANRVLSKSRYSEFYRWAMKSATLDELVEDLTVSKQAMQSRLNTSIKRIRMEIESKVSM